MATIENQLKTKTNILKQKLDKEVSKTQLLLEQPKDAYQEIREQLGWNSTQKEAETTMGSLLEAKNFFAEAGENTILSDDLVEILLHNNYTICTLENYKGKGEITEELLGIIKNYFDTKGENIASTANQSSLLLMFPFKTKYNEHAKKSSEIVLIQKISDIRKNNELAFKIVGKTGKSNLLRNKWNALFFNHSRQYNSLRNAVFITGLTTFLILLIKLLTGLATEFSFVNFIFQDYFITKYFPFIGFIALVLKYFIVPQKNNDLNGFNANSLTLNIGDDNDYSNLTRNEKVLINTYVFSEYNESSSHTYKPSLHLKGLWLTKFYNRINKVILLSAYVLFFYLFMWFPISSYLYTNDVTVSTKFKNFHPSTLFTFTVTNNKP